MRRLVAELDASIRSAPHRETLLASIGSFTSLLVSFPAEADDDRLIEWANVHAAELTRRVDEPNWSPTASGPRQGDGRPSESLERRGVRARGYLPRSRGKFATSARRFRISARQETKEQVRWLFQLTSQLTELVSKADDPSDRLLPKLEEAKEDYQFQIWVVIGTALVGVGVTAWMFYAMRRWIMQPIRQLKNGAQIVARGDYQYRLCLRTGDELAELADTFNTMTARFQAEVANRDKPSASRRSSFSSQSGWPGSASWPLESPMKSTTPLSAITACTGIIHDRFQSPPRSGRRPISPSARSTWS